MQNGSFMQNFMKNGFYAEIMHNDYEKWLGCAYYAKLCKIMKSVITVRIYF